MRAIEGLGVGGLSSALRRVADPADRSNRAFVMALAVLPIAMSIVSLGDLLRAYPWGIDLEIPLGATERWLAGQPPYMAEAFATGVAVPPFLYPPYALVLYTPLTWLPRAAVVVGWLAIAIVLGAAACRRLGFAWWPIPLVLLWPPFTEAFVGGNLQVAIFAAFVFLFARPGEAPRSPIARGLLGAATTFLKVSQPHALTRLARHEVRAFVIGIAAIVGLAAFTFPFTGGPLWEAWFEQLQRAADPTWAGVGSSVAHVLPAPLGSAWLVACVLAVLIVPRNRAAEWVGILAVLGTTGLRTYYLLFLIPAMLRIRREIALAAAFLMATYTQGGWWLGIALVAVTFALTEWFERRADPRTA